jgi:hypothetical protein
MIRVPFSATDDELMQLVYPWLDALADEDYARFYENVGYAMAYGAGAAGICRDIQRYRAPELYPDVSTFRVSDWRTAAGGNANPSVLVRRYEPSQDLPIVITIELDLPLNGRWSDLEAHFVVTVASPNDSEGVLWLEDIVRRIAASTDAWDLPKP